MSDDDKTDINNKIHELLDYSRTGNEKNNNDRIDNFNKISYQHNSSDMLIELLKNNEKAYKNIENELKYIKKNYSNNSMNNTKSDHSQMKLELIDNSLLCSNLISVLKETTQAKQELLQTTSKLQEKEKNLFKELNVEKERNKKLQENINYCTITNDELLRIIQDQKIKIQNISSKYEIEKEQKRKKYVENEELESLRKSSNLKIETLKKENQILHEEIGLRNTQIEDIEELRNENEKLKNKNQSQYNKLNQKTNENYKLNKELKKYIISDRKMKDNIKKIKEKMEYSDRLYKTVSEENEWLNSEMSKFIEFSEHNHDKNNSIIRYKKISRAEETTCDLQKEDSEKKTQSKTVQSLKKRIKKYKAKLNSKDTKISNLQKSLQTQKLDTQQFIQKYIELKDNKNNKKDEYVKELLDAYKKVNDDNLFWREKVIELERIRRNQNEHMHKDDFKKSLRSFDEKLDLHLDQKINLNKKIENEFFRTEKESESIDKVNLQDHGKQIDKNSNISEFKDCPTVHDNSTQINDTSIINNNINWNEFFKNDVSNEETIEIKDYDVYKKNSNGIQGIWDKIKNLNIHNVDIKSNKDIIHQSEISKKENVIQKENIDHIDNSSNDLNYEITNNSFESLKNEKNIKRSDFDSNRYFEQNEIHPNNNLHFESYSQKNIKNDVKSSLHKNHELIDHKQKINNKKPKKKNNILNARKKVSSTKNINKINNIDTKHKTESNKEFSSISSDTTSSEFKQIRSKTTNLEKRFRELEEKLKKIKINKKDNIKEQIDAYTDYYYTEFVDMSGDSDII